MPRRTRLTPELTEDVIKKIRAGVYPYIAAQAAGVHRSTFYRWMEKGTREGARGIYRDFADRVLRASASARAHAEIRVFKDQPLAWLKTGPGKEGWSERQTVCVEGGETPVQVTSTRPDAETITGALDILEQLGVIEIKTPLLPDEEQAEDVGVIDVESKPSGNGRLAHDGSDGEQEPLQ